MEFDSIDDKEEVVVRDRSVVRDISTLLSVSEEDLTKALCYRVIAAGGNVVEKGLTVPQAYYARDAFAKVGG